MTRLIFANPEWLVFCAVAIAAAGCALAFAFLHARRRSRVLLGRTAAVGTVRALPDVALLAGLCLIAVALLGPRIGQRTVSVSTAGVDAVILLDVSRSMRAQDVPPSRLDRARRIALELLERLEPGDRAALAAYSGRGVVLTPLSPDAAALAALLPAIDTHLVTPGGSKLRDGVERALEAFDSSSERTRVLVVLSDGEASGRSSDAGAASAIRANTRVVSVALGSEIGATIPDGGAPLLDGARRVVISRRRLAPLQTLADTTDGRLFAADEWGRIDPDALTREVRRTVNEATGDWILQRRTVPLVLPFAALAFGLLWLECARPTRLPRGLLLRPVPASELSGRRWLRQSFTPGGVAIALCALFPLILLGATTEAERGAAAEAAAWEVLARERPLGDSELLRLGVARAKARHAAEAIHAFRAVAIGASDPGLAAVAYHDLGVLALERGDLPAARDAFLDALALVPNDAQTRFNLEWTLRALAAQPPPAIPTPPRTRERDGRPSDSTEPADSPDSSGERDPSDDGMSPSSQGAANSRDGDPPQTKAEPEAAEHGKGQADAARRPLASASPLDAGQREMWLQRVRDDPSRALGSAAAAGREGRRSAGPTW